MFRPCSDGTYLGLSQTPRKPAPPRGTSHHIRVPGWAFHRGHMVTSGAAGVGHGSILWEPQPRSTDTNLTHVTMEVSTCCPHGMTPRQHRLLKRLPHSIPAPHTPGQLGLGQGQLATHASWLLTEKSEGGHTRLGGRLGRPDVNPLQQAMQTCWTLQAVPTSPLPQNDGKAGWPREPGEGSECWAQCPGHHSHLLGTQTWVLWFMPPVRDKHGASEHTSRFTV